MRRRNLKSFKYLLKYDLNKKEVFFRKLIWKNDYFYIDLFKYNRIKNSINNSSISKIRNRCIINGKSRSVYSQFRLSRHSFKHYASLGYLNGIQKKH